jgi:outer membrane receptor protein involved in Fe transport
MQYDFRKTITQLFVVLLVVFSASFVLSQGIVTGSISGTVEDAQGAVVNGAKVSAKHVATNREFTATTTATGIFNLHALPPGAYNLRVEAPRFRSFESTGVAVAVGTDTSLGAVKLEVGSSSETVTVEGAAAPLVESTTQQITAIFDAQKAQEIPIGNTLDSLALFVPGIATAGDASFSNNNGAEISVNGQRARSNNYQIDGQGNNDNSVGGPSIFFGNQDAIAELQIVTNYSAEYGRNMGAVVNYITKSGTNQFHGSAYEFYQGSHFDSLANQAKSPLFSGSNGLPFCAPTENASSGTCDKPVVPRVVINRFGGTLGGPVIKDKLWFFGSTNFEKDRFGATPSSSGGTVLPTPKGMAQLQAAFPNNPALAALANIGPSAVKAGNPVYTPVPVCDLVTPVPPCSPPTVTDGNTTLSGVEFGTVSRFIPALYNDYEATGRVDVKVTSKDNFFGRYVFQQNISTGISGGNGIAVGDYVDVPGRDQQIGLDWVRNFTSNFINQARFSYSRARFGFEGGAFPKCLQGNITNCPTNVAFGDGATASFGLSTNFPQGRIVNVYQVQDNASWQISRHTVKIGGDYTKQRSPAVFLPNVNGQYTYADFSAFLSAIPDNDSIASGNPKLRFKENDLAFYVQDDWRVRDNLTLNLGVRWEWFQQAVNLLHDLTVQQQSGPNPFWDPALPLDRTTVAKIPQDLNNFSPVVGFAWTPRMWKGVMGQDKTVIRGGFRIGYDPSFYNIFLNTATNAPVANSNTLSASADAVCPGDRSCPPGVPGSGMGNDVIAQLGPLNPTGGDPGLRKQVSVSKNFHNPYSEQWNFGVQRSIGQRMAAEVRYVGNHTVGNFMNLNGNPALNVLIDNGFSNLIPAGLTPCSDPTQPGFSRGYVDCSRTRVQLRDNKAFSIYHGLQTELRVANFHGLTSTLSYTFSKVIDNASEVYSNIAGGATLAIPQNPFDISRGERAVSGIDYPHVVGLTFIYDLPFFKGQQGFAGKVLGGWQLNSTYRYTTGQPYTTIQIRSNLTTGALSGSLCDSRGSLSTFYDACRPFVSNPSAPLGAAGVCTDSTAGDCGIADYNSFVNAGTVVPTTLTAVHWIVNDLNSAKFFGSPFSGTHRNTLRGQPISTANMSIFKNTRLTEKLTLELRATAFNVMNTQFLGVPDPLLDDIASGSFQNTHFNTNAGSTFAGNTTTDGINIRRLEFGAKFKF